MKVQPRYIVAKYIPEIMRNEPRNFGVIVWTPAKMEARFCAEDRGNVDGRKIPEWVKSKTSYKEWTKYLRNCVNSGELVGKGETFRADNPNFVDALKNISGANYVLGDTGSVMDEMDASDLPILADYLYEVLVQGEMDEQTAKNAYNLERACNQVIRSTKLSENERFKFNRGVICPISKNVNEIFEFDYYFGNGDPEWLYKRVPLGVRQLNKQVDSAAWQFEKVINAKVIPRDKGAVLIMPTDEQREEESVQRAISVLGTVTRVIDLTEKTDDLAREFDALAKKD